QQLHTFSYIFVYRLVFLFFLAVPPPRNVHVSCQNAKVSVSWDYSKQQPHTIFRINISGSSETTDHHFDLSHFVWKSEENYKDFLYVTVTAIQGDSQSEGVQSNSFSFNYLKTVDTQCSLDFPPVDVKEDESGATVSFPNPVHFYKELEQTVNPNAAPVFQYIVSSVKNHCICSVYRVDTCKLDVPFPEGVKKCVRLKGTLFDSNFVNQLVVRETAEICAHVSTGKFKLGGFLQRLDDRDSKAGSDQPLSDSFLYPDRRLSESSNQELEDCVSLGSEEDEQESVSPYDSPQAVMLDLGDGDMVTGYKG
uniref:Fibronectin type-III domain-containing protein n=1 Tax=Amphiprion percula TaxID=161767 RepID=A0A3P8S403_AMPPE